MGKGIEIAPNYSSNYYNAANEASKELAGAKHQYLEEKRQLEEELYSVSRKHAEMEGENGYLKSRNNILEKDRKQLSQELLRCEKILMNREKDTRVRSHLGERIAQLRKEVAEANHILEKVKRAALVDL